MPKFAWPPNFSTLLDLTIISQISNNSVFRAFTIRPKRPPSPGSTITTNRWRREFSHITVGCRQHRLHHSHHPFHLHLQWKITIDRYTLRLVHIYLATLLKLSSSLSSPQVQCLRWRKTTGDFPRDPRGPGGSSQFYLLIHRHRWIFMWALVYLYLYWYL